jgi:hypothetical protein
VAAPRRLCALVSIALLAGLTVSASPGSASPSGDGALFTALPGYRPSATEQVGVRPTAFAAFRVDLPGVRDRLAGAGSHTIAIPDPSGVPTTFTVVEDPVLDPVSQAEHPEIRTYAGRAADLSIIRLSVTTLGLSTMVRRPDGSAWYVDPVADRADEDRVLSYYGTAVPRAPEPFVEPEPARIGRQPRPGDARNLTVPGGVVSTHTYRLALLNDPSFADYYGTANVLDKKVEIVNRVNEIYNADLAIKFLVDADPVLNLDTDAKAIQPNGPCGAAACFTAEELAGCGVETLDRTIAVLDQLVGADSYDIGHLALGHSGGGIAYIGVVGTPFKGGGCTGLDTPQGDFYAVDYLAHEMGHQMGAEHTFNGTQGACGGNGSPARAVEPGSGSSIMAYAGICGTDDLQPHSDPYFSFASIDQINATTATGAGQGTVTATGNHAPVVTAPADKTIPARTPFTLTGSGTDADGDALAYLWEQTDAGITGGSELVSNSRTSGPLFRQFGVAAPVSDLDTLLYHSPGENLAGSSPSRTFPDLAQVVAGNTDAATGACPEVAAPIPAAVVDCYSEYLPTATYAGPLHFRLTARDSDPLGGGLASDDVKLTVDNSAGPFLVTSRATTGSPSSGREKVTWAVHGTNKNALARKVRIRLSTDGGATFPYVLARSTPNDGSEVVRLPGVSTSAGRIKVEAVGNYFFDVNDANFAIPGRHLGDGRGSFTSPRGSSSLNDAARGKARFAFSADAFGPRPSGTASFRFGAGDLRFSGTKALRAKVSGNRLTFRVKGKNRGQRGYTLVVVAVDTSKEKIRVRLLRGKRLVYDSMPGKAAKARPTTKIRGHVTVG